MKIGSKPRFSIFVELQYLALTKANKTQLKEIDQIKLNQQLPKHTKNQPYQNTKFTQTKPISTQPIQTKWKQTKPNQNQPKYMKTNQTEPNQTKLNPT